MILCKICSEKHQLNPPQRSMLLGWGEVDVKCPKMGLTARYKQTDQISATAPVATKAKTGKAHSRSVA
jgi:hypothetical protein